MIWKVIAAAGSLATVFALIISLMKGRKRLKISVRRELLENTPYVIRIHNTTNMDNGVESIIFWKGHPGNTYSTILSLQQTIVDGHFLKIPKGESYEFYIEPRNIVDENWIDRDKAFGKPTDKVFIRITDINKKHYTFNTGDTCGFIEVIAKTTRS